ncbi:MAG: amino acid transporter [Microbacterium sp.]|uniref:amino acid transporter n=1 Tax=Microbacterium sp. TaxID=51671 RepID=UPI0039E59068
MTDKPTRRDLMRPAQLLGLAFIAAVFAGAVTFLSMGGFERLPADEIQQALTMALVIAGITFIVVVVVIALLVLAIDPAQVVERHDHPVLIPETKPAPDAGAEASGDLPAAPDPAEGDDPADGDDPAEGDAPAAS